MNFEENQPTKIVHQGIDTLQCAFVINHIESYVKYQKILRYLANAKDEAILANKNFEFENGITFDFYEFGKFKIRPKGQGRYKFVILNQDITIYFSTVLFGANEYTTPQIKIDFSARYLTLLGHQKAYDTVMAMLEKLLSFDDFDPEKIDQFYKPLFTVQMLRIDLCTDVSGIKYTPLDKYRFQANFKNNGHMLFIDHMQFNRLTGFTFGKGDYMMRIYDKRLELNNNASKLYLTQIWEKNGYDGNARPSVWRHEVQMRRPYLKRFRKEVIYDEVSYFFDMLPNLWRFAFSKIKYVDIDNDQVLKIMDGYYTPDNLRQLFYRTNKNRMSIHWGLASLWNGQLHEKPKDYGNIQQTDSAVPKRFLKAFISTSYKFSNGDPLQVLNLMDLVQDELTQHHGYTLHDYGQNKLLSSFVNNAEYITNYGFTIDKDYTNLAKKLYAEMREKFLNLNDPLFGNSQRRLAKLLFASDDKEDQEYLEMLLSDINSEFNTAFMQDKDEYIPSIYEIDTKTLQEVTPYV